jgi:hypothetical protein
MQITQFDTGKTTATGSLALALLVSMMNHGIDLPDLNHFQKVGDFSLSNTVVISMTSDQSTFSAISKDKLYAPPSKQLFSKEDTALLENIVNSFNMISKNSKAMDNEIASIIDNHFMEMFG